MKTINLDTQQNVKFLLYPDNQPHVNIFGVSRGDEVRVVAPIRTSLELINLLQASNALSYLGAIKSQLVIPYLMAARSDRIMLPGDSFDLEVVADLINSCAFKSVNLFDVHSAVATQLIKNSKSHNNSRLVALYSRPNSVLIIPDAGAVSKSGVYAKWNLNIVDSCLCEKERNGKVVIRPDSGDPIDIICGDIDGETDAARKGVVELLWDVFGGTTTSTGHRLLDSHIGVIYGDSITIERAAKICQRLKDKGFASQAVFGIGSYTYQYNTRDTFGTAIKATHVVINGRGVDIFKDPKTDDGTKKSAKGLLCVERKNGTLVLHDECDWAAESCGELKVVFEDGKIKSGQTLAEIRQRLFAN